MIILRMMMMMMSYLRGLSIIIISGIRSIPSHIVIHDIYKLISNQLEQTIECYIIPLTLGIASNLERYNIHMIYYRFIFIVALHLANWVRLGGW